MSEFKDRSALVVDDDDDAREMTVASIESLGMSAVGVEGAEVALQLMKTQFFDIVLCDINMPVMSGLALLQEMRKAGISSDFIFLTGFDDGNILRQARRLGAASCLQKPFDISGLRKALTQVFNEHRKSA